MVNEWKYVCRACKKPDNKPKMLKSVSDGLEKKKKFNNTFDRDRKIVWSICISCVRKGKRLGLYFKEYERTVFKECPRCRSVKFTYSKIEPEKTCNKCGLVLEESIIDIERTSIKGD